MGLLPRLVWTRVDGVVASTVGSPGLAALGDVHEISDAALAAAGFEVADVPAVRRRYAKQGPATEHTGCKTGAGSPIRLVHRAP
jgi:hypothetical protein